MKRGFLLQGKASKQSKQGHAAPTTVSSASSTVSNARTRIPIPSTVPPKHDANVTITDVKAAPPSTFTGYRLVTMPAPNVPNALGDVVSLCMLFPGMKEATLAIPGWPHPPIPRTPWPPRYIQKPVPGAGMGTFVYKPFAPGDIIIAERPALVIPQTMIFHKDEGPTAVERVQRAAIENMHPAALRAQFLELHNCKPVSPEMSQVGGIINTNAVSLGALPGHGANFCGVGVDLARVNHSCGANAVLHFNLKTFQLELRAVRPLAAGEQVTLSYFGGDVFDPREVRREEMQRKYAFTCMCPRCDRPAAESKRSDARARLLHMLATRAVSGDERELRAWVADPSRPDDEVVKDCLRALELMAEEGIHNESVWAPYCERLVKAYCALGDTEKARVWAHRAAGWMTAYTGADEGWATVAAAPENTEWWGLRQKTPMNEVASGVVSVE